MKEKIAKKAEVSEIKETQNLPQAIPGVAERLSDSDQSMLENARLKSELALEKLRTAISIKENIELSYSNTVLQMAIKYRLSEGDTINEAGEIQRNS